MKRKNEESYTTGEFARYFGIKKDTLLYYDKIGLFSPAGVRPNGYRYYTPAQVEAFGALRSLREMNVPIQEIREYFGSPTPARLKEMAAKQAEKLQEEIRRLRETQLLFEKLAAMVAEANEAPKDRVLIRSLPAARYSYSRPASSGASGIGQQWLDMYSRFLEETGATGAVPVGSIVSREDLQNRQFGRIARLFIQRRNGESVREGGQFAVIYHQGDYETVPGVYPFFLDEIERLGFCAAGDAYEDYLIAELATARPEEYVTRITVRISPK